MQNLEYIDSYFKGELPEDLTREFEQKIIQDPEFADEVAYYLSAFQAVHELSAENKKQRFREIYQENKGKQTVSMFSRVWPKIAIAALLGGIIFGTYIFMKPVSTRQLAEQYIQDQLQNLSVTMGGKEDSMQVARNLYNQGKLTQALQYFESIIQSDTSSYEAKEDAGKTCLRMQQYDKALYYFRQMETHTDLYANSSLFYQALTLMKRNGPGDQEQAKQLLQTIVDKNLDHKEMAEKWLQGLK